MSTGTTLQIKSVNSDATERLAERLGRALRGGEVIELVSDLGGGKTTFVRGLARGAGSHDTVASPTFTISKQYDAPKFTIHHFDFYRLADDPGLIAHELAEVQGDRRAVVVIEWADAVQHVLPADRLRITIAPTSDGGRELTFRAPKSQHYLIEALQ